jgi:hypothetical protein
MDRGFETHIEPDAKLVVQRHWGNTTSETVIAATQELISIVNETQATRNLNLVSESEVEFSAAGLIESIEHVHKFCPRLNKLAYVIDKNRHNIEEMLIKTVAWNLDLNVGIFDDEAAARKFLGVPDRTDQ